MKTWVRKTLSVGVLAAGAMLFGPAAAHAADLGAVGNTGLGNGTQVVAPVDVPINVCGTGIGVIGDGVGLADSCTASAVTYSPVAMPIPAAAGLATGDNSGVANGAQVYAPVQVPVNVCGTGLGLLGDGAGGGDCATGVSAGAAGPAGLASGDNSGVANGAQVYAPVQVPVNVCGTGLGLLGDGAGSGDCATGASAAAAGTASMMAGGNDGALNGNQIAVPVQLPVNVCGTGLGLVGDGAGLGTCGNGASATGDDGGHQTLGETRTGNGLLAALPIG